jgi:hypothetical protein
MLSALEYRTVSRSIILASVLGFFPAEWVESKKQLVLTRFVWKKVINPVMLIVHLGYLAFVIFRVSVQFSRGTGFANMLVQFLYISIHIMSSLYHLHVILYSPEIVNLFNFLGSYTNNQGKISNQNEIKC